jgi:hypothetical protein
MILPTFFFSVSLQRKSGVQLAQIHHHIITIIVKCLIDLFDQKSCFGSWYLVMLPVENFCACKATFLGKVNI